MLAGLKTKIAAVGFVVLGALQGAVEAGLFALPGWVSSVGVAIFGALGLYGLRDKLERMKPGA